MKALNLVTTVVTGVLFACGGCSSSVQAPPSGGQRVSFTQVDAFGTGVTISMDWGDYDGDGDLDLAVGNSGQNYLYTNDGNGNFTEKAEFGDGRRSVIKWADTDGDEDLDLLAADDGLDKVYVNEGGGVFREVVAFGGGEALSLRAGDLDGDGDIDVVTYTGTGSSVVFLNEGGNTFVVGTTLPDVAAGALVDVDGDLDLDIIVGGYTGYVFKNDGNASFTKFSTFAEKMEVSHISLADHDGDGDLDLVHGVGDGEGDNLPPLWLYDNDGVGNFSNVLVLEPGTVFNKPQWGDIDADGDPDLVVASWGVLNDRVTVYINQGDTFPPLVLDPGETRIQFPFENAANDVTLADVDNDGDIDIAVGRFRWISEFVFEPAQNSLFINNAVK